MSGRVGDLSPKQESALQEFRKNVQDILNKRPECNDDYYLLRWLRARAFDLKKSEAMLRDDDSWREQNSVDTILEDFEPPVVMQKYYIGGLFGQDKEGSLIWVDPAGYLDMKGILMSMRKQDVIKSKVWMLEKIYRLFKEKTEEQGRRVDQIVIVFDLEKFGLKHLWKPGVDVFTEIVATFEKHYPETLKRAFVINAPRIFPVAYNLLRPFLSEETHKKVVICSSNYRETLLQHIDADQLPKHWGGSCTDPDGNPRCPSKIGPGGEVPSSFYCSNNLEDVSGFTQASIGRGSSLQLDFVIDKANSAIRWQFKTEGFDIGFGVYRRTNDQGRQKASHMEPVLPSQRVNSHMVPEDGSLQCRLEGTYVLRFDNTYSWLKSKKLFYLVEILEPQTYDLELPSCNSFVSDGGGDVWTSFPTGDPEEDTEPHGEKPAEGH